MSNRSHIKAGKYHWKAGVRLPVKAQEFGDWVMSLPDQEPHTIVEAARNPKAVAHALFNWDDKAAALENRLSVARRLYGCLVVEAIVYKRDKPVVHQVKAFVRGGRNEPYEPMAEVLSDPGKRDYLLSRCLAELTALRREYASLSELAIVFAAIDKVSKRKRA